MAIETEANSALIMDRGLPIGNSEDVFLRRAAHVKIGNKPSEAIPTYDAGTPGVETVIPGIGSVPSGGSTTLISATVPAGKTWFLSRANMSCSRAVKFTIKEGMNIIGTRRTSPAKVDADYSFIPKLPILSGTIVTIEVTSPAYNPTTDAEAFLLLNEI